MNLEDKLNNLIKALNNNKLDGFIIPSNDAFQSEYVPAHARRLEWLTGFSGSNGIAVVLSDGRAAFFTDGRYTLQAQNEVPDSYERYNLADLKPYEWLAKNAKNMTVAYDAWLHTKQNLAPYSSKKGFVLKSAESNLIDQIWVDKPLPSQNKIEIHPLEFAGKPFKEKLSEVTTFINENNADYLLLTAPDSICWLLNIRGQDVPCTPLVLSYAFVSKKGDVNLFTESAIADETTEKQISPTVRSYSIKELTIFTKELNNKTIIYDDSSSPIWFTLELGAENLIPKTDPCQLPKAIKNKTEITGSKNAHIHDGAALTKMLFWLEETLNQKNSVSETDIADKLIELRSQQPNFKEPSFGTIAGFNANGAIIHYQAKKTNAATLNKNDGSMLLIDSGGQYLDGTTDITRTVALGKPTKEQKQNFTRVLKGHIALASAVFPKGTTGSALDVLARQFLWQAGLDYQHGTGHGVGSYLGVHEGPQRISKIPSNIPLQEGMILSNEPGVYKQGKYGIRIESLVIVKQHDVFADYLTFETISKAPIDLALIERSMLNHTENLWLSSYHSMLYNELSPLLTHKEKLWLKQFTL